jgi:hypothetical protein
MLKTVLIILSMSMAVGMYIPLFNRFRRRHRTRDFSKPYCWLNLLVQVNNGILAIVEHAPFLVVWYTAQTIATGLMLWFVYRYWNSPPPEKITTSSP